MNEMAVRREHAADVDGIRAAHEAAFRRPDEAALVEALRRERAILGSFVCVDGGIVGHILFSRTMIETPREAVMSVALAPLAVLPAYQRRGVGSRLVRTGLEWLRSRGERSVLVLGDPRFYSRFGFSSDRAKALKTPFPPEAFMALELMPDALECISGPVQYASAFAL